MDACRLKRPSVCGQKALPHKHIHIDSAAQAFQCTKETTSCVFSVSEGAFASGAIRHVGMCSIVGLEDVVENLRGNHHRGFFFLCFYVWLMDP